MKISQISCGTYPRGHRLGAGCEAAGVGRLYRETWVSAI